MSRKIHNRVATFRAERAMTRKGLAEHLKVNPQTVGFLERGDYQPSLELAMKLAELLNVPVETLFSFQPFPPLATLLTPHGDP